MDRRTGRGRLRRAPALVVVAAVVALAVATIASADSLTWSEDGNSFAAFGANQQPTIYLGTISFIRRADGTCIDDFVTAFTDVYVVPHGSVTLGTKLPTVAVGGAPHVIGSTASGGLFIDEPLGFTGPAGKIGKGLYDVVYDNCQDGIFGPDDTLFSPALSVDYNVDIPEEPPEYIAAAKEHAKERLEHYKELHESAESMFLAFKAMEIMLAVANEHTAEHFPVPHPDPGDTFFFTLGLLGPLQWFEHMAVNEIVQTIRHYQSLVDDPPDPDFKHLDTLDPRPQIGLQTGAPVDLAAANVGTQLASEAALVHALRVALERYNGARAAGDPNWALVHARAIRSLATSAAQQLTRTTTAIGALSTAVAADGAPLDEAAAQLERIRQHWLSGLTPDDRRELRNLGYSDAQIDALRTELTAQPLAFTKAGFASTLSTLQSTAASMQSALTGLAGATDPIVAKLAADPIVTDASPAANAGGPYTGAEGTPISFDASASTSPSAITTYSWDLDGDGVFGDATGATPTYTYSTPFDGLVGLQVTNADGVSSVAYAPVHVANVNSPPRIDSVSPDPRRATIVVGSTKDFSLTATDPENDPVTVKWTVDDHDVATGSTFTYAPTAGAIGVRTITATVTDGNPLGGFTTSTWEVLVVAADADGDGWNANVDCNDGDANVNPGHVEVVGNGKDDDCSADTPDSGSPPVAAFSFGAPITGQAIQFTDASTDPNGDIKSWAWDFGDLSGTTTAQNPTHTYTTAGTYTVTLKVTDATGQANTLTKQVTVTAAPVAAFTYVPPTPAVGGLVQFTDTSSEAGGTIASWTWSFGDGGTSTDRNPSHAYATPGAFTVTLTIADANGVKATATGTVTVGAADPGTAPHAAFEPQGAGGFRDVGSAAVGATIAATTAGGHAPPATLIDGDLADTSYWAQWWSSDRGPTQTIVVSLPVTRLVHGVKLIGPGSGWYEQVKDFDVAVSTTTSDASAFSVVASATTQWTNTWQEFDFAAPRLARYVEIVPHSTWVSAACCYSLTGLQVLSGQAGGRTVSFANTSTNASTYRWDFGDGTTSTDASPTHTFAASGDYTVALTARASDGRQSTFALTQTVVGPKASFTVDPPAPPAGFAAAFTDTSSETAGQLKAWSWNFGDGTGSTSQNPVHVFAAAGSYTVTLTTTDDNGISDAATQTVSVGSGSAPIALFDPQLAGGQHDAALAAAGGTIDVTNTAGGHAPAATLIDGDLSDTGYWAQWWSADRSAGQRIRIALAQPEPVDAIRYIGPGNGWYEQIKDFDVAVSSTTTDPSAFTTVLHATTDWVGTWQEFRFPRPFVAKYVEIRPSSTWVPSACCYSATGLQVLTGADGGARTVTFKNLSQNATSYGWDFGDGATSTEPSPTHTYGAPGTYTVTLTATGAGGSATYTSKQYVRGADLTWSPAAPTAGDYVQFTDASPTALGGVAWAWDFGDGGSSTRQNPLHTFAGPGTYTVTLTVKDGAGTATTATKSVTVSGAALRALFSPEGDANAAQLETGATVPERSSQYDGSHTPEAMLDRFTEGCCPAYPWATASGTGLSASQFVKIALAPGGPWLIDHFDVMPRPCCPSQRVKDFEVRVSTTTLDESAFTSVLQTRATNDGSLQRFDLPTPVLAKYVEYRPLSNWGADTCCISTQQLRASTGQISGHTVTFTNLSHGAVSYSWDFGDGTTSTAASPTHTYAARGTYTVTLTAKDGAAATSTYSLTQRVLDPVVPSFALPATGLEGTSVSATDTTPALADGSIVEVRWNWGDGAVTTGSSSSHAYADDGTYAVTETVTDSFVRTFTTQRLVVVANVAPSVNAGPPRTRMEGSELTFDASVSDPGAYDNPQCKWSYGDGATSTGCRFDHVYSLAGTTPQDFTATVTATDKDGASSSSSVVIHVTPAPKCGAAGTGLATASNSGTLYYTTFSGGPNIHKADFSYAPSSFAIQNKTDIAATPGADGVIFAPDGDLLIGGQGPYVHKLNPATGTWVSKYTGGPSAFHMSLDPSGQRVWAASIPGTLAELPLSPFADGVGHNLNGDDGAITSLSFDGCGTAWYTSSGPGGYGDFGIIDLATFTTTRLLTAVPAAHGMVYDKYSGDLILMGSDQVLQFSPRTFTVVSQRHFPGEGFDQGTADGRGHVYAASNGGDLVFLDYSASKLVGDPSNFTKTTFLAGSLDDVAPLTGFGAQNHAPVATDGSITVGSGKSAPVTLAATDADGDPLTFTIASQPVHGTLSGTPPNLTYTAAAGFVGVDSFTFKASDGKDFSNVATVAISVTNGAPTAFFDPRGSGGNLAQTERGASVVSSSSEYPGYPASTLIDADQSNSYWATANGATSGSVVVALAGGGASVVDRVGIRPAVTAGERVRDFAVDVSTTGTAAADFTQVLAATAADDTTLQIFDLPRAIAGVKYVRYRPLNNRGSGCCVGTAQLTVVTGQEGGAAVHFVDLATDPDGDALSYQWTFGDGSAPSTQRSPDHVFPAPGAYTVTETVSDGVHSSSFSLVQKVLRLPAAAFTTAGGTVARPVAFTDASTSPESTIVEWSWTFGDGATSTDRNPTHAYSAVGTYSVKLSVTDAAGGTASTTRPVVVRQGYATLTTGPGDGGLTVDVGGYGDFGYQLLPESVAPSGRGDALYDPVGPAGPGSTSWESALQLRRPGQLTSYLTSGLVGAEHPQGALDNPGIEQTSPTRAVSSFDAGGLHFELEQTVASLTKNGVRTGSVLTQTYQVTNTLPAASPFDLLRYYEGDLKFGFGPAVPDGGGHLVSGGTEFVFQTDRAGTAATGTDFVGVTADGGQPSAGRYEVGRWTGFPERIRQGVPLCNCVFGDLDGDGFVDAGLDYDVGVALSNGFGALAPGGTATYVTKTYFGSGPPAELLNRPPVANGDAFSTHVGVPYAGSVLGNDSDPDGDPLTAQLVAQPAHGHVDLAADGSFVYTPAAGAAGSDSFTYRASDGTAASADATVTIAFTNTAPHAGDDAYTVHAGATLHDAAPGPLANDGDADGDALAVKDVAQPAHGHVALATDGALSFTPDAGFVGDDAFTYTVTDGTADSAPATVTLHVVDAPPVAAPHDVTLEEDGSASGNVLANDADPDGDPLHVALASGPQHGHATLAPDGTFAYTPDADFNGTDSFAYVLSDGILSVPGTVTLTVREVNDPPTAHDDAATTSEDAPVVVDVAANDSPGPANETAQHLSVTAVGSPQHGTAAVDAGGVRYVPDANYSGADSVPYTVCDDGTTDGSADARCASATLTLDVRPVNDAPTASDTSVSIDEDAPPVTVDLRSLAHDLETASSNLTYAITGDPSRGRLTGANGVYAYDSNDNANGTDTFTYRVTDRGDPDGCAPVGTHCDAPASATGTVTIHIAPVDDPPTVTLAPAGPVDEGGAGVTLAATAHDIEAEDGEGGTLTYTWSTDHGAVTPAGDGSHALLSADDGPATAHVTVTVSDGALDAAATQPVEVRNVAPAVAATAAPTTQYWGLPVHFAGHATDPSTADTAYGFVFEWSFGDLVLSPDNAVDHAYAAPGSYAPTFSAVDKDGGRGATTLGPITIAKRTTSIAFTAPTTQPFGPTQLAATLADTVDAPTEKLAGHRLSFVVGGRTFTATTDASGLATVAPAPFLLSGPVTVSFPGDALYAPSSATAQLTITNAFGPGPGFFAVGDRVASVGATVSWWTSQWAKLNPLSRAPAPNAFKGYANSLVTPRCGALWSTDPGNSSGPPAAVGPYLAVVVPSHVEQSGSTITGNAAHVVAVRTTPGYGPAPGHDGTGQVVATIC